MSRVAHIDEMSIATAAHRVMSRCNELARESSDARAITRVYLSAEHARVNRLTAEWMREVGMTPWVDAAGNQMGVLRAADPDAPSLMLGSHLDTVVDAGRFDGVLGVLMAIEVVRMLRIGSATDGQWLSPFPFGIEVAAFSDEEGTRFGRALLGSSAVARQWNEGWLDLVDADGITLRSAYQEFGLDPSRINDAARGSGQLIGYLEAHIEQGPELDRSGDALAVVSSIASAKRFQVTVEGEARHAGGTPYDMRRDALLGASEAALAVERICSDAHHIIGTVGQLEAFPGAVNVVPGEARFSIDLRGEFDTTRDASWIAIEAELEGIMARRGLRWHAREVHAASAVFCDPLLKDVVSAGISGTVDSRDEPISLFSPAGHDGMMLGEVAPVGMLFLRNPDGISHHPDESVSSADVATGLRAFAEAIAHLGAEQDVA